MRENLGWLKGDYRAAFRAAAAKRAVDSAKGSGEVQAALLRESSYQAVHRKVRERRANYDQRAAQRVRQWAEDMRAGLVTRADASLGRGLVDVELELIASSALWWMDREIWVCGAPSAWRGSVENRACGHIRREISDMIGQRHESVEDLVREVLTEMRDERRADGLERATVARSSDAGEFAVPA